MSEQFLSILPTPEQLICNQNGDLLRDAHLLLSSSVDQKDDTDSRNQRNLRVKITQTTYFYEAPITHRATDMLLSLIHPNSQDKMS
ncbi:hypothetical protein BOTNAR_0015g00440 [Botryotinia narcissicola]|uniref:Uncharacterized protein n=1 Tax=Botryotinia narcissicola TaxID=278944 RepID=A0A4Z1J687_9HELO|nr:hypothetical protein BOTNAR_0015g00440 [Botryotinia narcissicola]